MWIIKNYLNLSLRISITNSMKVPNLNLNHFKVFVAVYETRSMTLAAEALHITQSGVSQHIKALEEDLGLTLFTRAGRKIVPTPIATDIFPDVETAFIKVSERIARVTGQDTEVSGVVRIGMPVQFGVGILVPMLASVGQKYPKLTFEVTLDYGSAIHGLLTNGGLDFGFVDDSPLDRRLQYRQVYQEDLVLCANRAYISRKPKVSYKQSYFEELDYVEYKGAEQILRQWMAHHLKRKNLELNIRARIMDVQGVANFIQAGLGVGVLPDHVVSRLRAEGADLYVFEGKAVTPLRNHIHAIRLKHHPMTRAADVTLNELMEQLGSSRR